MWPVLKTKGFKWVFEDLGSQLQEVLMLLHKMIYILLGISDMQK